MELILSPSPRPSAVVPTTRDALELATAWDVVRAASRYLQDLDDLVVRYDRWADSYESVGALLDAGIARLAGWVGPSSPARSASLKGLRDVLIAWHVSALASTRELQWGVAQGSLFEAGTIILAWAMAVGVEL